MIVKRYFYLELKDGKHDIPTWGRAMPVFLKWAFALKQSLKTILPNANCRYFNGCRRRIFQSHPSNFCQAFIDIAQFLAAARLRSTSLRFSDATCHSLSRLHISCCSNWSPLSMCQVQAYCVLRSVSYCRKFPRSRFSAR